MLSCSSLRATAEEGAHTIECTYSVHLNVSISSIKCFSRYGNGTSLCYWSEFHDCDSFLVMYFRAGMHNTVLEDPEQSASGSQNTKRWALQLNNDNDYLRQKKGSSIFFVLKVLVEESFHPYSQTMFFYEFLWVFQEYNAQSNTETTNNSVFPDISDNERGWQTARGPREKSNKWNRVGHNIWVGGVRQAGTQRWTCVHTGDDLENRSVHQYCIIILFSRCWGLNCRRAAALALEDMHQNQKRRGIKRVCFKSKWFRSVLYEQKKERTSKLS